MINEYIGLVGYKYAGKDSVADRLIERIRGPLGHKTCLKMAFADPVKQACSVIFNVPLHEFYVSGLKELEITHWPFETRRDLMKKTGTEALRSVWPEVWVENLKQRILDHATYKQVVVTDVRFQNEFDAMRELGATMVYVDRQIDNRDNHSSESNILELRPQCDITILNTGTLKDLDTAVDEFLVQYNRQK